MSRNIALREARERIDGLGLAVSQQHTEYFVVTGDSWELWFREGGSADTQQFDVTVRIADDEQAAEMLQPLGDLFGRLGDDADS